MNYSFIILQHILMIQITKLPANGRNDFSFLFKESCHCFWALGLIVRPKRSTCKLIVLKICADNALRLF